MDIRSLLLFLGILTAFSIAVRVREKRSASSFMSEQLLYLRVRQSLVPVHKSLEELAQISRQSYTLPLGLSLLVRFEEFIFEHMQVFSLGSAQAANLVFFLHGGAYVEQPTFAHWIFLERLIRLSGCRMIVPIYPKAPDHHVDEVLPSLLRLFLMQESEHITLMGDSAGGGLALALAQSMDEKQKRSLEHLILISPWLDIELTNPSTSFLQKQDPMLSKEELLRYGKAWRGDTDAKDWRVSPLFGSLADLPPTTLFIGTHELFLADARSFWRKAKEEATMLEYHEGKRMNHDYPLFPIPEARRAQKRIAAIIGGRP